MARELVWTGFMTLDGIVDSPGGKVEGHPHGVVKLIYDVVR